MTENLTVLCNDCGEQATVDSNRKRGTVLIDCDCDEHRRIVPSYDESVVIGNA